MRCPACNEDQPDDFFVLDPNAKVCDACHGKAVPPTLLGRKTCDHCQERKFLAAFRPGRGVCYDCEKKDRIGSRRRAKNFKRMFFRDGSPRDCPTCGVVLSLCNGHPVAPIAGKVCPGCETNKPFDEFGKDASRADGMTRRCRDCEAARKAVQRADHARRMGHTAVVAGTDDA